MTLISGEKEIMVDMISREEANKVMKEPPVEITISRKKKIHAMF